MNQLIKLLRALFAWTVMVLAHISYFVFASIAMWFYPNPRSAHFTLSKPFVRVIVWSCGVKVAVLGMDNVTGEGPYIFMSNHVSMLDIGMMVLAVPVPFRFISKKELGYVPVLGWAMILQGQYLINRKNAKKAYALIEKIKTDVAEGQSLVIFPEGTRSKDGHLKKFKKGSFKLAVESGATIIPCYIHNVHQLLPKNALIPTPGTMTVSMGKPLSLRQAKTLSKEEKETLVEETREKTRQAILALQKEMS